MGPLAQIFSTAEGVKRKLIDALRNPRDAAAQFVGNQADRARNLQGMTAAATDEFVNTGSLRGPAQSKLDQVVAEAYNPMGMVVYHGSPHKFTKFDSSKIGTGEGAQAYGHGLYLAESPEVSKTYMRTQINNAPELEQMALRSGVSPDAANTLAQWFHNTKDVNKLDDFLSLMKTPHPAESISKFRQSVLKQEPALRKAWEQFSDPGSLYKVDLPDEQIARMLDWDKPLSQQAPAVRQAIQKTRSLLPPNAADDLGGDFSMLYGPQVGADEFLGTMNSLQPNLGESLLQRVGVPGVRYLDQGSRGAGSGTSNFVVFPGNENMLQILERNGQPLGLMGVK